MFNYIRVRVRHNKKDFVKEVKKYLKKTRKIIVCLFRVVSQRRICW